MDAASRSIALSLISHTNAGKTTLARTLLGRDVGEVRDEAHVTTEATPYPLIANAQGDTLVLWDTPGFGDSARLARRLALQGSPIGWFLSQVWDRFRERPLWLAQAAVRNVRDQADVVLYLVNAAEPPEDAGYLDSELRVLAWIGKPVIALLNQTGSPRGVEAEAAEEARWRRALASHASVAHVLSLDAFARCWVQEIVLLRAVAAALPVERRDLFDTLASAWESRRRDQFGAAMLALAHPIAEAARDEATLPEAGRRFDGVRRALGLDAVLEQRLQERAMRPLAERLDLAIRRSTDSLIAIHGLEGQAAGDVTAWMAEHVKAETQVSEGKAAMLGGVVSGALSGLVADIAAGGLTLGAGVLLGGVVGALGGAGIARGVNTLRGARGTVLRWSDAFLDNLVRGALLRYLAVAHYGRGRGPWRETPAPAFWQDVIARAVARDHATYLALWQRRGTAPPDAFASDLRDALAHTARAVLDELYPGALAT